MLVVMLGRAFQFQSCLASIVPGTWEVIRFRHYSKWRPENFSNLERNTRVRNLTLKAILNDEAAWWTRAQPPLLKIVVDHLHSLLYWCGKVYDTTVVLQYCTFVHPRALLSS